MASQNRSAGYCIHCQRGVTVIKPTGEGFFGRVRTAVTNNEDSWVCSKCGKSATKGFKPASETRAAILETPSSATKNQDVPTISSTITRDHNIQSVTEEIHEKTLPSTNISTIDQTESTNPEAFTIATTLPENSEPEAKCHLCGHNIRYKLGDREASITCPDCQATVFLPATESELSQTSSPGIIKLEDDPERPAISKAICTQCQYEMTYPKKLTGKEVDCPSCNSHFQLP